MDRELSGALSLMKPKLRIRIKDVLLTVRGFFIPFFMMGTCLALSTVAIIVTILVMMILEKMTEVNTVSLHSVGVAIITGIAASSFISVVIEGGNNYRWNQRRQLILSDYLRAVSSYEFNIQARSVHSIIQVCQHHHIKLDEAKCHGLFGSLLAGKDFAKELDEEPELPNRFTLLAKEYAKLYPVLKEAYVNNKEYLKQQEIDVLDHLFKADQTIRHTYGQELICQCHGERKNEQGEMQWPTQHKLFPDGLRYAVAKVTLEEEVARFVNTMMQHGELQEKVNETLFDSVEISIQQLYGGTADENWEEHGGYNMVTDALLESIHILEEMEEDTCTEEQREKKQQRHRQFVLRRLSEAYQEIDACLSVLRRGTWKEPCYWIEDELTKSVLEQNLYCLREIQNQLQEETAEKPDELSHKK